MESSDSNHPADCLAVMVDVESLGVVVAAVHLDVRGTAPLVYVEVLAVLEEHVDLLDPTTIIIMIVVILLQPRLVQLLLVVGVLRQ